MAFWGALRPFAALTLFDTKDSKNLHNTMLHGSMRKHNHEAHWATSFINTEFKAVSTQGHQMRKFINFCPAPKRAQPVHFGQK